MKAAFCIVLLFLSGQLQAQLVKESWSFGFGGTYPRYISTSLSPKEGNYGAYMLLQNNISEHVGLRLKGSYLRLEAMGSELQKTNLGSFDLDLLYNFVPCESVSPFLSFGAGEIVYKYDKILNPQWTNKTYLDYQLNFGLGVNINLDDTWRLKSELNYHTPASNKLDGMPDIGNGILGGRSDTYMTFSAGLEFLLSKGELSRICDIYSGIGNKAETDYDRIESIVKKYQISPKDNVDYNKIEDIVKRNQIVKGSTETEKKTEWILVGVNFKSNSANFKTEAFPILFHAATILIQNPELKVEIQGYTDNIGSEKENERLSLRRAEAVKQYLTARGINPERLTTLGMGSSNPVSDNRTAAGRLLNRRIEFKVLN